MALPVFLIPAIKFLGPVLPFFKVAALGSIKLVFLFIGSLVAPVHTFMLLNIMTVPTVVKIVKYMLEYGQLSEDEAKLTLIGLDKVLASAKSKVLTRAQARNILITMQKNIIVGIKESFFDMLRWIKRAPRRVINWFDRQPILKQDQNMQQEAKQAPSNAKKQISDSQTEAIKDKTDV